MWFQIKPYIFKIFKLYLKICNCYKLILTILLTSHPNIKLLKLNQIKHQSNQKIKLSFILK